MYKLFNMSFTGFLINGNLGDVNEETANLYCSYSPDGVVEQAQGGIPAGAVRWACDGSTPLFTETDLPSGDVKGALQVIESQREPMRFTVYRTILQPASYHKQIVDALSNASGVAVKFLEPLEFSLLSRVAKSRGYGHC
jgi:hypothetical protein